MNGPAPEGIFSRQVFESKVAAERAVAALRKTMEEIRASAAPDHDR